MLDPEKRLPHLDTCSLYGLNQKGGSVACSSRYLPFRSKSPKGQVEII
jgi:hypothetical protein